MKYIHNPNVLISRYEMFLDGQERFRKIWAVGTVLNDIETER